MQILCVGDSFQSSPVSCVRVIKPHGVTICYLRRCRWLHHLNRRRLSFTVHQIAETYKQVLWRDKINVLECQQGRLRICGSSCRMVGWPMFRVPSRCILAEWKLSISYRSDRRAQQHRNRRHLQPGDPKSPLAKYDSYVITAQYTIRQVIAKASPPGCKRAFFLRSSTKATTTCHE